MNPAFASPLPPGLVLKALEAAGEGVVVVDGERPDLPAVWVNAAFERLTGFAAEEIVGGNLRVLQGGDRNQPALGELREALKAERSCSVLLRNYRPDGGLYWHSLRLEPWRDPSDRLWWIGFSRDVSLEREMEIMLGRRSEELDQAQRKLAEVDPVDRLTGLQSGRSFELALELSWFSCARERRPLALFLFAPDYFDVYLETFGRVAADSCLRMLARAVGAAFRRASDVAARLEDAEFAALGTNMPAEALEGHAQRVCERVHALAIRNPHAPLNRTLTVSAVVMVARPGRAPGWRGMLAAAREELAACQAAGIEQVALKNYGEG